MKTVRVQSNPISTGSSISVRPCFRTEVSGFGSGHLGFCSPDDDEFTAFSIRIREYMLKAMREAKVNTSWISPNTLHEDAVMHFIDKILKTSKHNNFIYDFEIFQKLTAACGIFNSLSQTLLKITSPGIIQPLDTDPTCYRSVFTGEMMSVEQMEGQPSLALQDILSVYPLSLLERINCNGKTILKSSTSRKGEESCQVIC